MNRGSAGIRELKARLSTYISAVKSGATIVVTEHGRPVARLVPEAADLEGRLRRLNDAGMIQWSGRRLGRAKPEGRLRGKLSLAEIVVENRG
jgi:prevent-host-death family protein